MDKKLTWKYYIDFIASKNKQSCWNYCAIKVLRSF